MHKPSLYIIAGPNGAGKTTASMNILPEILDSGSLYDNNEKTILIADKGGIINNCLFSKIKESCLNKNN